MPKILDLKQGSQEWLAARCGIPTSSNFHRIITPKTRKRSAQLESYAMGLTCERWTGRPLDNFTTAAMNDGTEREDQAVASYELTRGVDTRMVGFITTDDGRYGASPDRMVIGGGLLECKNPKAHTHVAYLLGEGPEENYKCQLQGQLLVTGAPWVDIISCYPGMPDIVIRVEPDAEFIATLGPSLNEVCDLVDFYMEKLKASGYEPFNFDAEPPVDDIGPFAISQADVDLFIGAKFPKGAPVQ